MGSSLWFSLTFIRMFLLSKVTTISILLLLLAIKAMASVMMLLKFMFSKNATKIDKIFIVDLTLCSKYQIYGEDFVNFCGLLRKHKLYMYRKESTGYFQVFIKGRKVCDQRQILDKYFTVH